MVQYLEYEKNPDYCRGESLMKIIETAKEIIFEGQKSNKEADIPQYKAEILDMGLKHEL